MKEELRSHATQGLAESWPVLKRRRAGYKPKQTKLIQNDVTRPVQERAKVLADHYANKQWATKPTPPLPARPVIFDEQAPIVTLPQISHAWNSTRASEKQKRAKHQAQMKYLRT